MLSRFLKHPPRLAWLLLPLGLMALGYEGRRLLQLWWLALPPLLWLAWPLAPRWARVRRVLLSLWLAVFVLDALLRSFLQQRYQAAPDSALVLSAVANTHFGEGLQYLGMTAPALWPWAWALVLCAVALVQGLRPAAPSTLAVAVRRPQRRTLWVLLLVLALLPYASKPWRRLHPVQFWAHWSTQVHELRQQWGEHGQQREQQLEAARQAQPQRHSPDSATVVLALTESVNRDNLQLYGYPRDTTPELSALRAKLPGLLRVHEAWSVEAATVPALQRLFHFGQPQGEAGLHLLALARAAGYKVWWISNHDDLAIEQLHARLADHVVMVNRAPGRASRSLDEELLPALQQALQDDTPHKLIVLHMLGAHPHYKLRHPEGHSPFDAAQDAVSQELQREGRPVWVRELRDDYDAALHYHDSVVARTLSMTSAAPADYRAWFYVSDHGQEVGHEQDRAGHSPRTAAGYRVPLLAWQSAPRRPLPDDVEMRAFRADWAGWSLLNLLDISWRGHQAQRDVLDPSYRWQPPDLPLPPEELPESWRPAASAPVRTPGLRPPAPAAAPRLAPLNAPAVPRPASGP
ncbi:phosphoethanolamine transferase [Roseateles sp. BYS180W]|uniref:Phosphoethanolamine transferase n=1 Tax=Roseateles rivi TaxID=3299028 RepID=A0ABW7FUD2_9BURK